MNNARTNHTVDGRKAPGTVIQQCVHKRALLISRCRMHHHTAWLVDHQKIVIFINNLQRYVLRLCMHRLRRRNDELYTIRGLQTKIFVLYDLSVTFHVSGGNSFVYGCARQRSILCQKHVDSRISIRLIYHQNRFLWQHIIFILPAQRRQFLKHGCFQWHAR